MRQEKLRRFLALEQQHIDRCVEQYFGYYLLLLGDRHRKRVTSSPVQNHFVVSDQKNVIGIHVIGDSASMPFAPNSVDVIILLHALEQTKEAKQMLEEAYRLLRHDGHLVVVGFNPWRPIAKQAGRALYGDAFHKRYSLTSVLKCLNHIGFEVSERNPFGFCLNKNITIESRWERLGRRLWPALGMGYCLIAEKKTSNVTPLLYPSWVPPVVAALKPLKPLQPSSSQHIDPNRLKDDE
jgi:SAM-dependent methyltransferase